MKIGFCAFEASPLSSVNIGSGQIHINFNHQLLNCFIDPGSLAGLKTFGIELASAHPFQISGITQETAVLGIPVKDWGFAAGYNSLGNKLYRETTFSLMVGKKFFGQMAIGTSLSYYELHIVNYGSAGTIGLNASLSYNILSNWILVTSFRNINAPRIGSSGEKLPQVVYTGFSAKVNKNVKIQGAWEQDMEFQGAIKFGIMSNFLNHLTVSAGYVSYPAQICAGLQLTLKNLSINYAVSVYQNIGRMSSQLGIGIRIHH
ncbi:MAG: hypothetical protein V3U16_08465 [Candidatus Neomarinimicrobiota bacterium]